jgi:hypothetical protein
MEVGVFAFVVLVSDACRFEVSPETVHSWNQPFEHEITGRHIHTRMLTQRGRNAWR